MKIVVFGTGKFYQDKKQKIPSEYEIVAFLDNNPSKQGQSMDGCLIFAPEKIRQIAYDKIVLMSASEEAMKSQLVELGVNKKDIWYWERFNSEICRGIIKFYYGNPGEEKGKKILIISAQLDYTGAPIAAVYAAELLQERGYHVFLAAPTGDKLFIKEMSEKGINIVLCPALPYMHKEELFWVKYFDAVLVNVFPMILCAYEISKIKPVLWWIHEAGNCYKDILTRFDEHIEWKQLQKINTYAVSEIAQRNFNFYFPDMIEKKLNYGLPDRGTAFRNKEQKERLVFALIGTVCPRKAQDVFLDAIELLEIKEKTDAEFLLIGSIWPDEYGDQIKRRTKNRSMVKITGVMTQNEIFKMFENIDVVVCPSLEDPLPIVATEGMMYGKVCIVSDATGTADYIEDGKNGLICKAGDPEDLYGKMSWVMENREKLKVMGEAARMVYEKHFTMESFGQRLEKALQETIDGFYAIV